MDLNSVFMWVLNSGGNVMVASWILERIGWYQSQLPQLKQNIFLGVSVLISLIVYCVMTYVPAEILSQIAPFFAIIYVAAGNVFVGTAFHKIDKQ